MPAKHLARQNLNVNGRAVPLTVRVNPRARRFILRLDAAKGGIIVVAPSKRSVKHALAFALRETDWIAEQLAGVPEPVPFIPGRLVPLRWTPHMITHRPHARRGVWLDEPTLWTDEILNINVSGRGEHVPRRVRDWLKHTARRELVDRCRTHEAALGLSPIRISVRDTTSRWGSCGTSGALSFSWRLIMAPPFVLDYVAAHETAHRIHMNHGAKFWKVLDTLTPRRIEADRWLDQNGHELHRFGALS